MTGKLLQVVGVLAILGLCGAAIGGFAVLKDRVRVVVQLDDVGEAPDPTALVRDDVQVLSRDVDGLRQAVAQNFGQLAEGLEIGATKRHADVVALQQQVHELAADSARLAQALVRMETRMREWQAASAAAASAQPTAAATEPDVDAEVAEPPVTEPAPEPPPVERLAAEPKSGFLSFRLPSTRLAFDDAHDYVLLPQLCRVGFDAKSTLHDFTGVTSMVKGRFRADFDDPQGLCSGEVTAEAKALKTGVDGRDSNMWEYLDAENHPEIRFALERFEAAKDGVDVAAKKAQGEVIGKMTIRGKTRDVRMPVTVEVDPQQRVVVTGQQKLLLSDYDVPVPSQLGLINMQDEVTIWVALRARAQAGDGK